MTKPSQGRDETRLNYCLATPRTVRTRITIINCGRLLVKSETLFSCSTPSTIKTDFVASQSMLGGAAAEVRCSLFFLSFYEGMD